MTSNNKAADIAFNPKRKFQENEAKVKFMNFKSQNVVFFNSLPHFDCDSPTNEKGKKPENIDSCPTKKFNFFVGMDRIATKLSKEFIPLNSNGGVSLGFNIKM